MNDNASPAGTPAPPPGPALPPPTPATPGAAPAGAPVATPAPDAQPERTGPGVVWALTALVVGALSLAGVTVALMGQQKIKALEQELVKRQQDTQGQAIEARALARQAQETAQSAESKVSLMDARVAEVALQRGQLEDLLQQLSRSRDENLLADLDAAVRVAMQQSALTGSAEPTVAALTQAEERLSRMNQPRVDRVRRAVVRDLERLRAAAVVDIASLAIKLDEVMRSIDDLPLQAQIERRLAPAEPAGPASNPTAAAARASAASPAPRRASAAVVPPPNGGEAWLSGWRWLQDQATAASARVWHEVRSLVRVTQVDNQDAMLVAPQQAWFLRENLKLRLLNARLALLARQNDTAQSDLREVQASLDRYFDRKTKRVQVAAELVRQVSTQSRTLSLPRPDETLAALTAVQAGR